MALVAPSILAANWATLSEEVKRVSEAGANWLHLDVMDGNFVPPITFGSEFVASVNKVSDIPLDVHLMVEHPETHLEAFSSAGADIITVHLEACPHIHRTIQLIHELGCKAGVALNPGTPVGQILPLLPEIDLLLLMTVNPGWGGQKFIPSSESKIREAAEIINQYVAAHPHRSIELEVDGGINKQTAAVAKNAGATVLVAGTAVFKEKDYRSAIEALR